MRWKPLVRTRGPSQRRSTTTTGVVAATPARRGRRRSVPVAAAGSSSTAHWILAFIVTSCLCKDASPLLSGRVCVSWWCWFDHASSSASSGALCAVDLLWLDALRDVMSVRSIESSTSSSREQQEASAGRGKCSKASVMLVKGQVAPFLVLSRTVIGQWNLLAFIKSMCRSIKCVKMHSRLTYSNQVICSDPGHQTAFTWFHYRRVVKEQQPAIELPRRSSSSKQHRVAQPSP